MSGRIAQRFIDSLLNKLDIVSVISQYVSLKKQGANYSACCPFHDEKTPSFSVSPAKQFYYCFGCGAHGNAIGFVQEYLKLDFVEAIEELASQAGMEVEREASTTPVSKAHSTRKDSQPLFEVMALAQRCYQWHLRQAHGKQAIEYLKARGLSGDIAQEYGLGYAPAGWDNLIRTLGQDKIKLMQQAGLVINKDQQRYYDRFRQRIMFPIRDLRGRTIAFGGRVLSSEDNPKYLNSPESPIFHKSRTLYGLYEALQQQRKLDHVIVVEGYMDVIALAQFGIHQAVATLGTAVTIQHIRTLGHHTKQVIFCFDGDQAGIQAAWRALKVALPLMDGELKIQFLLLPQGEDPDTFIRQHSAEYFLEKVTSAMSLGDFMMKQLSQGLQLSQMDDRARFLSKAIEVCTALPDGAYRSVIVQRVAEICHMSVVQVQRHLVKNKPLAVRTSKPAVRLDLSERAITMLMHDPTLTQDITVNDIEARDSNSQLLVSLIIFIHKHAPKHSGAILQQWPEPQVSQRLAHYAAINSLETPPNKQEFSDLVEKIKQQQTDQKAEILIEKSKHYSLSEAEKDQLRQLLKKTP